jgi:hypothetical protein
MSNTVKTEIIPSENWNGFTFAFSNGWSVSIQQSENHYCKVGKTAEVAIFDPKGAWWGYDDTKCELVEREEESHVLGWTDADDLARIIALVAPLEIDIEAKL